MFSLGSKCQADFFFFIIIPGVITSLTSPSHETVILAIYNVINIDDLKSQLPLLHLVMV